MKNKVIIPIVILIILSILFIPIPGNSYDDGGTREYKALTYKIVKWYRFMSEDTCYDSTRFYFGKDKNKSIDELWLEIDPPSNEPAISDGSETANYTLVATVIEINDSSVLVTPIEGSWELNSSDKIFIPRTLTDSSEDNNFPKLSVGDEIEIQYNGVIAETYPAWIDTIYSVEKITEETTPFELGTTTTQTTQEYVDTTTAKITTPRSQAQVDNTTKTQTTKVKSNVEVPTAYTGTTIISTFVITKVSGTYLELNKIDGNDAEKLTYSCDLGSLDNSTDVCYKVGDYITLRYDQEIAETYPLQLTVREIYPTSWNDSENN